MESPMPRSKRSALPSAHRPAAWLKDAVFYEIYPQTFLDSNGDGIGDLPGIISKLDYVKSLGCNALWINPCFQSPFKDAGYDVSDFYKVAPRYGTNADLKRLFREARRRGIRVCLDLVAGHTSVEHPWFQKSADPTPNKYSNWYIWTRNWWDDTAGQPGISGYSDRNGKYITNFFYFQPALNYGFARPDPDRPWQLPCDHPDVLAVRAEIKKIMRFWLDMGASGFRVDMAPSLVKNDKGHVETTRFWHEVRAMLDRDYPEAVLISEWGNPPAAINAGFDIDFMLPFIPENRKLFTGTENLGVVDYSQSYFGHLGSGDAAGYFARYLDFHARTKGRGFISIPSGNHDTERLNHQRTERDMEIIFAFIMTMPGVPFIYYGDEIGLRQMQPIRSKEGGYNRTSGRTPMQWSGGRNAGFSTAPARSLYTPIDPSPDRPTVAEHESRAGSLLRNLRELIALRKQNRALQSDGAFEMLHLKPHAYPLVYLRRSAGQRFVIALNPSPRTVNIRLGRTPAGPWGLIRGEGTLSGKSLSLPPTSYAIWRA
jgi:glycosidase